MMTLSWIAGFYEGEGNPSYTKGGGKRKPHAKRYLNIKISQCEKPILDAIRHHLGFGHVYLRRWRVRPIHHRNWILTFFNHEAHRFAKMILPLMQSPKKKKQLVGMVRKYK